ncbi:MAG: M64 family metallopeptidase, partial [Planctomycetota bacterium]
ESGLTSIERRRPVLAPSEAVSRLQERTATAFSECRFRDLAPIYYSILGLRPDAEARLDALEGLVEARYLERLFEDFLEAVVVEPVQVSLSEHHLSKVVRATDKEVESELDIEGHPYSEIKPWNKISDVQKFALFQAVRLSKEGTLGLAFFAFHIGYEEGAHSALIRLHRNRDNRELVNSVLSRHLEVSVPERGFVVHRGRLMTPDAKVAVIARRKKAREEEKAAIQEMKRMKRSQKLASWIVFAQLKRQEGFFELAHTILNSVLRSHPKTEEAADARRLMEDPVLAVTTLVNSGPSSNRLDFYFLGEGYPVKDEYQEQFLVHANTCMLLLLKEDPYREYQSYLNFFAVQLGSRDRDVDKIPGNVKRDTPLDGKVEWDVFTVNRAKVMEILDRLGDGGADHQAIVIGNCFAGVATGGGGVSCLSKAGPTAVSHELGHSLASLRDEYDSTPGNDPQRPIPKKREANVPTSKRPPNLMAGSDRKDVLAQAFWQYWIRAGEKKWWNGMKVSVFEGGDHTPFNVWRPQQNCKMRSSASRFCVVCMEVMVKSIYKRVRPIDGVEPGEAEVVLEEGKERVFKVWPMKPESHTLTATWTLLDLGVGPAADPEGHTAVEDQQKGELYKRVYRTVDPEGRLVECAQLRAKDLREGRYRLRVEIHDPTPWVIRDPMSLLTETHEWTIKIQ